MFFNTSSLRRLCLGVIPFVFLISCKDSKPTSREAKLTFENVIPIPVTATLTGNTFILNDKSTIVTDSAGEEISALANYLAEKLKPATGFDVGISTGDGQAKGNIYLTSNAGDNQLGEEGYELVVGEDRIKISANTNAGLFHGIQTLRQIMPYNIEQTTAIQNGVWEIATGTIRDYPEYKWRGSMLDVARHFRSVDDVKRYIDLISLYKMNTLHLHLSDDQGWRIEIKSWPNLGCLYRSRLVLYLGPGHHRRWY